MATPKEDDPLWMLYIFYFVPCEVMYQHVHRLKPAAILSTDEGTRNAAAQEFISFFLFWFASLFVVAEGWKTLKVCDAKIDKMIDEHFDSLRLIRNAVFHFQRGDQKHQQFFDMDKFNWAEKLHSPLREFFAARGWYHG